MIPAVTAGEIPKSSALMIRRARSAWFAGGSGARPSS
jgi:hypothetical protein